MVCTPSVLHTSVYYPKMSTPPPPPPAHKKKKYLYERTAGCSMREMRIKCGVYFFPIAINLSPGRQQLNTCVWESTLCVCLHVTVTWRFLAVCQKHIVHARVQELCCNQKLYYSMKYTLKYTGRLTLLISRRNTRFSQSWALDMHTTCLK